jgi:hypothetical protein
VCSSDLVQSFDSDKQTVTVQLCIRERINLNGVLSWETLPLLVDVPVFMPRAGGFCITMPVSAGDECLVVFGDSCMDAWWQSGGIQNQMDKRRHDLSDGYALMGIWSQPKKLEDYSTNSIQIRNNAGTNKIELSSTGLTLQFGATTLVLNAAGITLNGAALSLTGTSTVNITSPTITETGITNIVGATNITGDLGISAIVTMAGKVFSTHTHGGVTTGNGTTGAVS